MLLLNFNIGLLQTATALWTPTQRIYCLAQGSCCWLLKRRKIFFFPRFSQLDSKQQPSFDLKAPAPQRDIFISASTRHEPLKLIVHINQPE